MAGESKLPAEINRENWAELMTDVDLWRPVLEQISAAAGLAMSSRLVAGYPGSCAVFVVDEQVVIKLFPPMFAADFEIEQVAYQLLHGRVAAVPTLIASGIYCDCIGDRIKWPFLICQFCLGDPIRILFPRLTPREKIQIAQQVGQVMQTVHQIPVAPMEPLRPWPDFLIQRYHGCLAELRNDTPLPHYLIAEIESFLLSLLPELSQEPGLLLNADLTEDHALLSRVDGRWCLQAVIDWADTQIGPPAYEWVAAWFGLCRMDEAMFRALVSSCSPQQDFDKSFRRKLLACTFLHRFGPLIVRERWQMEPPAGKLSLDTVADWLWPGINI